MNIRKHLAVASAAAVLGGGVLAGPAVAATADHHPASAGVQTTATHCGKWYSHNVKGAGLKYKECHRTYKGHKQSSVALYLWDTKHDGRVAVGNVRIGKWEHNFKWGNEKKHSPKLVSGWHNGADAHVIVRTDKG